MAEMMIKAAGTMLPAGAGHASDFGPAISEMIARGHGPFLRIAVGQGRGN